MIGYLLDTHFGPYDQPLAGPAESRRRLEVLATETSRVEDAGFDGIFLPDRHARTECAMSSSAAYLSVLATQTTNVTIGTYALVLSAYHPMRVAEDVALADLLSEGRVVLGVSMGYHPAYWAQFGIDPTQKVARFEDGIHILKQAWTGETFSYHGDAFELDDVRSVPAPFQPDGPPLWIGGESRNALSRAGRWADGWGAGIGPLDRDRWMRKVEHYRTTAEEHGRDSHVALMRDGFVAPTFEEAARLAGPGILAEQQFYYSDDTGLRSVQGDYRAADLDHVREIRDHLVIGSPDDCVEQIERFYRDFEIDSLILRFRFPLGPDPAAVLEAIDLFGEEVRPRLSVPVGQSGS